MEVNFQTPILFLVFNRPDYAQQVFNEIKKQRPKYLFVAGDGPRTNKEGEFELCQKARQILNQIDWDCELKTLFRQENLGCGKAVSGALDWFFSQVEEGIILEDDCVPNKNFFDFSVQMLEKYRFNDKVMMISGTNNLLNKVDMVESYFFSRVYTVWGWATWRRSWTLYDYDMTEWPDFKNKKLLKKIFSNKNTVYYYQDSLDRAYRKKADTWDSQWAFTGFLNNRFAVMPKYNLVTNIGIIGTHTVSGANASVGRETKELDCSNLVDPTEVSPNLELENMQLDNCGISKFTFYSKVVLYLKSKFHI